MRAWNLEGLRAVRNAAKKYVFCIFWMLMLQFLSCLACWGVLLLFGRDYTWEWLVYTVGLLFPFLWGVAGYWLPNRFRISGRWQKWIFWLLIFALPAALSWWADRSGWESLWMICTPQLMGRLSWFYSVFKDPTSAFVLNTLQPLSAAGMHLLLMTGFFIGFHIGWKKKIGVYDL